MCRGADGIGLQLLAQVADEDAQVLHVLRVGRAPDGGQQLAVGEHPAAAFHQLGQEVVLAWRQLHRLARARHQSLHEVDLELARVITGSAPRPGEAVARGDAQAGQQLADAEGLLHIVVGAQVQRVDLLGLRVAGRQDDDRSRVEGSAPGPAPPCRPCPAGRGRAPPRPAGGGRSWQSPPRRSRRARARSRRRPARAPGSGGSAARRRSPGCGACERSCTVLGQADQDARAARAVDRAGRGDAPAHGLHEALGDGEPQPRALAALRARSLAPPCGGSVRTPAPARPWECPAPRPRWRSPRWRDPRRRPPRWAMPSGL